MFPLRRVKFIVCVLIQPCLTLFYPTDHSPPGPFVHGILQARILEWVAMPSSWGSSQPSSLLHNIKYMQDDIFLCLKPFHSYHNKQCLHYKIIIGGEVRNRYIQFNYLLYTYAHFSYNDLQKVICLSRLRTNITRATTTHSPVHFD